MNGFTLELRRAWVVVNSRVTGVVAISDSDSSSTSMFPANDDPSDAVSPGAAFVTRHNDVLRAGGGASASGGWSILGDFNGGGGGDHGDESWRLLPWPNPG